MDHASFNPSANDLYDYLHHCCCNFDPRCNFFNINWRFFIWHYSRNNLCINQCNNWCNNSFLSCTKCFQCILRIKSKTLATKNGKRISTKCITISNIFTTSPFISILVSEYCSCVIKHQVKNFHHCNIFWHYSWYSNLCLSWKWFRHYFRIRPNTQFSYYI